MYKHVPIKLYSVCFPFTVPATYFKHFFFINKELLCFSFITLFLITLEITGTAEYFDKIQHNGSSEN